MSSVHVMLLILLICGSSQVISGEEEDDESSAEASAEDDDDAAVTLTKEICLEAKDLEPESFLLEQCCVPRYENNSETLECMNEFISRREHGKNPPEIDVARLAECVYIKRKFTKGMENLNFKRIKAAADKLDDPRERKFMMVMYKTCSDQAKLQLNKIKANMKPGELVLGIRRPFYALVYMCVFQYSTTTSCPYFMWERGSEEKCAQYASECRKLLQKNKGD